MLPAVLLVVAAAGWACGPAPDPDRGAERTSEAGEETIMDDTAGRDASVHEVLARHREAWMARPEVTGTGVGRCDGEPCLVVYLRRRTDEIEAFLPDSAGGYAVRLEETGPVTPSGGEGGEDPGGVEPPGGDGPEG